MYNIKAMTTSEVAASLGTSNKVILENAKKCLPDKDIKNGVATLWTEAEVTVLLEQLKTSQANQHSFTGAVKDVSTKLTPALKIKKAFDLMREGYEEELAILKAQNAEQQKQLTEAQPKVSYYDNLIDTGGLTNLRNTAKLLKIPERKFIKRLEVDGYLFRNKRGELEPYSEYTNLLFEIKEWQHGEKSGVQTFVTVFGKKVFLNKYQKEQAQ